MADNIEKDYFFIVNPNGDHAWHKKGHVLTSPPTKDEAYKLAYGGRTILESPIVAVNKINPEGYGPDDTFKIEDQKAIFNSDGVYLGTVGIKKETYQPWELLEFYTPFIESGMVDIDTGGSLRGGTQIFISSKLKGAISDILPNDSVRANLLAATSFNSSLANTIKWTGTRVVCANTLAIALKERAPEWRIRNTENMRSRIANVQEVIKGVLAAHQESVNQYQLLAHKRVTDGQIKTYVNRVLTGFDTIQLEKTKDRDATSTKTINKINRVIELVDTQKGLDLVPAMRGTMWQAYNAVTEHLTYEHGRDDNRLASNLFGDASVINQNALQLALTM